MRRTFLAAFAFGSLVVATAVAGGFFQVSRTHSEGTSAVEFQSLSLGDEFTCGLTTEGSVMCLGG